ncbi:hypothetical protein EPO34_03015 [Patescibacteria group bacterium]|nr:MAG: hypothetical protein EPO34_03015 [Patescibacteria group bacterium]
MEFISNAIHNLLLSTHNGWAAVIYTSLVWVVAPALVLGFVLNLAGVKIAGFTPLDIGKWWLKWFLLSPIWIPIKVIQHAFAEYAKSQKAKKKAAKKARKKQAQGGTP